VDRALFTHLVASAAIALVVALSRPGFAAPDADDAIDAAITTVAAHIDAIARADYDGAEAYFSESFRIAIKPRVSFVNSYLLSTFEAIKVGDYSVLDAVALEKPEYVRVDTYINGRSAFYYLVFESAHWAIELFSDEMHESLADARRELYLFTNRDWNDTGSKELKCRAALYRIQQMLELYKDEKGEGFYPPYLRGGMSRDALTIWEYFNPETGYPLNYFTNRPMEATAFGKPSPGDFAYLPIDTDDNGNVESYYLVGWGAESSRYALYTSSHIISMLASADDRDANTIAADFVTFVSGEFGIALVPVDSEAEPASELDSQPSGE
jgi:hypothetical protein